MTKLATSTRRSLLKVDLHEDLAYPLDVVFPMCLASCLNGLANCANREVQTVLPAETSLKRGLKKAHKREFGRG